jgi:hypothetical protein
MKKPEVGSRVKLKNPEDPDEEFGRIMDGDTVLGKWVICFDDDFFGEFHEDQFEVVSNPPKKEFVKKRFDWAFKNTRRN